MTKYRITLDNRPLSVALDTYFEALSYIDRINKRNIRMNLPENNYNIVKIEDEN